MKVLHLYSDYKWTGPAEPTVNLCLKLRELGHDVRLACCPAPPGRPEALKSKASARGLDAITTLGLSPSPGVVDLLTGTRRVTDYVRREKIDIVHVHQGRDHIVGGLGARRSHTRVRVVRSNHRADPMAHALRSLVLLNRYTDGLIEISSRAARIDATAARLPSDRAAAVDGAVDLERFSPKQTHPDIRSRFGMDQRNIVVGIVARLQRHRHFDLFLRAMEIASGQMPGIRGLVLGRGTHRREVGIEPARRMGLGETVVFAGHLDDGYEAAVAAFDMKVFLVPGSDGSCRAVLESMAMAKPVIAAKHGILPEIVEHERTGLLVNDDPSEIADAILRLAGDPALRRRIGLAARAEAERRFTIAAQAEAILHLYENVRSAARG